MAGDNNEDKKGFSGLKDLVSDISGIDEPIKPEPKAEAGPSAPKQPPQPKQETLSSEPERKATSSPSPVETVNSGKSSGGSGGKWILGIIGVVFVIWLINNGGQSNKKPSYNPPSSPQSYSYPQSSPAPSVQTPKATQSAGLQYTKPSVGTNNVLSVPEIRWCMREGIRIEAMRAFINNNEGIDKFNKIVYNYNSRCGSYRYRQGSRSRAKRDVEPYRSQIVSDAIREARHVSRSHEESHPSVSRGESKVIIPKKPSAKFTREAQRLLRDLGYNPGPIDGQYGRRTADAVKAFQRDAGIKQDGWIDQDLISVLRRTANQRNILTPPKVGSRPLRETKKFSGIPANAHIDFSGRNWECDRGFRRVSNECVRVSMPLNAHIDYTGQNWECNRGFRQVGNKCVKIQIPANSHIDYTGHNWECDRGFRQVSNECVKFDVPLNAHIDYTGRNWECDRGFLQDGNKCIKFRVPHNAHIDYTGRNWECDRGYRPDSSECIKFFVPANAHVDYTGRNWECDRGYKQLGNKCVSFLQ